MKKQYSGLVSAIGFFAVIIAGFGTIAGLLNGASIYGDFMSAVAIIVSSLITGLLLGAVAAGIDLLAQIANNTRITRHYFEPRLADKQSKRNT